MWGDPSIGMTTSLTFHHKATWSESEKCEIDNSNWATPSRYSLPCGAHFSMRIFPFKTIELERWESIFILPSRPHPRSIKKNLLWHSSVVIFLILHFQNFPFFPFSFRILIKSEVSTCFTKDTKENVNGMSRKEWQRKACGTYECHGMADEQKSLLPHRERPNFRLVHLVS